ncbi:MAG: hypothetical protein HC905_18300 [Bacteroidales bacterium]|nr:hypothetical protein [Bacteroidales bacterium]
MAEISCIKGDFAGAFEQVESSISTNQLNTKGITLKAAILRKMGEYKKASETAQIALTIDPMDFWALNELYLSQKELKENIEVHYSKMVKYYERLRSKLS